MKTSHPYLVPQRLHWLTALLLMAAVALAPAARGGDEGIYGAAAPPNSAFVRVYNATPQSIAEPPRVGTEDMNEVPSFEASEFVFLPPGAYTLTVGAVKQPVTLQQNKFYTAVYDGRSVRMIENERFGSRLKALVIVYNLLDGGELSLKTADGRTTVVDKVAPNAFGTREVNPVRTNLALYRGSERVAGVRPVTLERGKAFSLFVTGSQQQPLPVWVVN